ncbi:MAG: tRNA dihydrouridine synthase DusB [Bacteroidales bacterium]|nr:tRNA dihydrouridine synthase DusB [Bacteroidales bacterium]
MITIGNIRFTQYPLVLAPMEDITDRAFRLICKQFGADLVFTEFVSSEGLIRDADKSLNKMVLDERERPLGIQIFGHDQRSMVEAARYAAKFEPDLIDINFGCPVKKVVKKGGGAAALKDPERMIALTRAIVEATDIPVSVKTRLGWDEESKNIDKIAEPLQDTGIAALTIHGRTRAQFYKGRADWTLIRSIKDNPNIEIPIIGNGDIDSVERAARHISDYRTDAIMIGRAVVGNPWIFKQIRHYLRHGTLLPQPSLQERIDVFCNHLQKAIEIKGEKKATIEIRKFYSGYFKGIPRFKPFKIRLMKAKSEKEVHTILNELMNT